MRFVLAVSGSLLVASGAGAQDSPVPPGTPPPAPAAPPDAAAPPSEPAPPPSEPPVAPPAEPAPSSTAAFPTDTPAPVLAPLPDSPAPPPKAGAHGSTPHAAPASSGAPAAAPADAAKPSEEKPPEENLEISKDGLFGPFRIGVLFGAGLPSFFAFSGELRLTRYFGAGVRFGFIPNMQFSYYGQASVSYQDYGIYAHLHPFGGGFLLGAEVGYEHADGSYASSFATPAQYASLGLPSSIAITTTGTVQTLILTPEIGYVYTWRAGFTFGFDVGAQIPVAPSSVSLSDHVAAGALPQSVVDSYLDPDRKKVHDTLAKVGQTVLPAFHFRIGWLL